MQRRDTTSMDMTGVITNTSTITTSTATNTNTITNIIQSIVIIMRDIFSVGFL